MAANESKTWWTPIIITALGFVFIMTPAYSYLPVWLLNAATLVIGFFMIGLILIQRGKGGGLAGAFGGAGGSSPFGSRAGDLFTRYTITIATLWLWIIMIEVKQIQPAEEPNQPVLQGSTE